MTSPSPLIWSASNYRNACRARPAPGCCSGIQVGLHRLSHRFRDLDGSRRIGVHTDAFGPDGNIRPFERFDLALREGAQDAPSGCFGFHRRMLAGDDEVAVL